MLSVLGATTEAVIERLSHRK